MIRHQPSIRICNQDPQNNAQSPRGKLVDGNLIFTNARVYNIFEDIDKSKTENNDVDPSFKFPHVCTETLA